MADSTITYLVLAGAVILFVTNRVPIALVAIGVSVSLWATGVLDLGQSLAGFGDPTVIFIAALFVVADCLENTGVTAWMGQQLLDRAGSQRSRVLIGLMVTCAVLTAFVTPNASVAALLPAAVLAAMRTRQNSSQLLMPMAFAAHAGSMLALTGAPANVLVAEAAADADAGTFSFFSFAIVGVPLLIGTVVITVALGRRVLPHRNGRVMSRDFGSLARTLVRDYELDADDTVFGRRIGSVEVVLPPRTPLIGQRAFAGMVTDSGELVVVGVRRNGRSIGEREVVLRAGDSLLLRGTWEALDRQIDDEVLVVDDPGQVRRQIVPLGLGAKESLVVLAGMVALLVTGAVPPAIAAILAAGALVLLGVTDADQAFRSISWTTVVLVAGMIPLSTAMQASGAARQMADRLVDLVGDSGPYALLVGLFVLVAVLGQLISNTATALIVIPVGVSAAAQIDVSPMPVLMCINIAAAAALLTPVATPANLMVMEPGGYRFGSYVRLGLPVMAWYALIAVVLTPLVWRF